MILHRFMSEHEFDQFRQGELLENDTDHRKDGADTDSVGFCFFPEEPDDAIRWLSGIVTDDVCATFDVPDHLVTKSRGTYCDPDKSDNSFGAMLADIYSAMMGWGMEGTVMMEKTEYCCTAYSARDFKLLRFEYSKRVKEQRRQIAEWDRTKDELPEGVLVLGTVTRLCNNYAVRKIAKALSQTIWKDRSHMTAEYDYGGYVSLFLPDGRLVIDGDSVEVHQDGVILVNGKLTGDNFPQLTINSGCFPDDTHYGLRRLDGEDVEIPKDLYMKYEEAMRQ